LAPQACGVVGQTKYHGRLPEKSVCKNCGFMSTRGNSFDMEEGKKLCKPCSEQETALYENARFDEQNEVARRHLLNVEKYGGLR